MSLHFTSYDLLNVINEYHGKKDVCIVLEQEDVNDLLKHIDYSKYSELEIETFEEEKYYYVSFLTTGGLSCFIVEGVHSDYETMSIKYNESDVLVFPNDIPNKLKGELLSYNLYCKKVIFVG